MSSMTLFPHDFVSALFPVYDKKFSKISFVFSSCNQNLKYSILLTPLRKGFDLYEEGHSPELRGSYHYMRLQQCDFNTLN